MGNEVTIAVASATAVEQSAAAAEPAWSLRDQVLAGKFFGERHTAAAAELAAFLHGGLDAVERAAGMVRRGPCRSPRRRRAAGGA